MTSFWDMNTNNGSTAWVVGQHALDRHAYRALLSSISGYQILGDCDYSASNILEAIEHHPSIFVFIADFPTPLVQILLRTIHRSQGTNLLVIVSANYNHRLLLQWVRSPIDGLLTHDSGDEEFQAALQAIENHRRPYFSDHIKAILKEQTNNGSAVDQLSPREAELLPLLASGLSLRNAADKMAVSYKTADSYRSGLFKKLKIRDRVELALYAASEGIINL